MSPKKIILGAGFFGVAGTAAFVGTTSSTLFPKKCWYNQDGKFWDEIEEIISENKDQDKEELTEKNIEELRKLIKKNCKTNFENLKEEFDKKFDDSYSGSELLKKVAEKISDINDKLEGIKA